MYIHASGSSTFQLALLSSISDHDGTVQYVMMTQRLVTRSVRKAAVRQTQRAVLRAAAICAAGADNVWVLSSAIGNQRVEDSTIASSSQKVAHRIWHGSRNKRLVQCKYRQVRIRSQSLGDGAGKSIIVKLQKLHRRPHPTNALDRSSHEVVVDIQSEQAAEGQELRRESTSQLVEIEIDKDEICEHSNFSRNWASQTTALHAPNLQA
jgi:hypothetical protein